MQLRCDEPACTVQHDAIDILQGKAEPNVGVASVLQEMIAMSLSCRCHQTV